MSARKAVSPFLAVVAVALTIISPAATESCGDVIEWKGLVYSGARTTEHPVSFGAELGKGVNPCSDEGGAGCSRHTGPQVQVFRLRGVDTSVAVGVLEGETRVYYLGTGYFPGFPITHCMTRSSRVAPIAQTNAPGGTADPPSISPGRWTGHLGGERSSRCGSSAIVCGGSMDIQPCL